MNLSKSNNNAIRLGIKKLKPLTPPKDTTYPLFRKNNTIKNNTPAMNQIPILLRYKFNNNINNNSSTNISTTSFRKIFNILKENNSKKNFSNIFRFLLDEPSDVEKKSDKNLKSNEEMKIKFFIRQREGLKGEHISENVLNIYKDTPVNKSFLNLKNKFFNRNKINKDEKKSFNKKKEKKFFRKKFYRNSSQNFLMGNKFNTFNKLNIKNIKDFLNKSKENKQKNDPLFFPKLINSISTKNKNQKNIINEFSYSKGENIIKNNNNKIPVKKDIGAKNNDIFKKICNKIAKKRAKMLTKSLFDIQNDNDPYEIIYEKSAENKVNNQILFNNSNLDRFIKVEKTNKKGFNADDIINSVNHIKNYNDNTEYILKKLKQTREPRAVKVKNFSHSTLEKYNNLFRSNFGLPS